MQKSAKNSSSLALANPTPPSTQLPPIKLPINLLGSISILINNALDFLVVDGETKQSLVENIFSQSKAALPFSVQLLY